LTSLTRTPLTAAAAAAVFVCRDTKHSTFTHYCHMEMTAIFTWILKFTKNISKDKTLGQYIFCT
jgi:hypothetical protein